MLYKSEEEIANEIWWEDHLFNHTMQFSLWLVVIVSIAVIVELIRNR